MFLTKREQQEQSMLTLVQHSDCAAYHAATAVKIFSAALGGMSASTVE
jgi:hypothetical protein